MVAICLSSKTGSSLAFAELLSGRRSAQRRMKATAGAILRGGLGFFIVGFIDDLPAVGSLIYVARFAGSGVFFSAYPQLALWAASFAGSGLFFSISGSRDRPSATGAKAHGLTCSLTRP